MGIYAGLRIAIGLVFMASGMEKLLSPLQNFLYVIQGYQLGFAFIENGAAYIVPWLELCLGAFLVLGLWLKFSLRGLSFLTLGFILVVAQALLRGIDLKDCGCFGEWLHIPPQRIILLDTIMLTVMTMLLVRRTLTARWSLDQYYSDGKR